MKRILSSILFGLFLTLLISFAAAHSRQDALCDKFVRVHILADSNRPYDQTVKLGVRDYLFATFEKDFARFSTKQDALAYLSSNTGQMEAAANEYLQSIGYDRPAKVSLSKSRFPEKQYSSFLMPPGQYDALKVIIGSGKGKNFFCVMFPPACVSSGVTVSKKIEDVVTPREEEVLEGKISYRFKLLELFKKHE